MIFKYRVKRNGIYYEAGQDVPMESEQNEITNPGELMENVEGMSSLEESVPKRGRPKKTE